MPSWHDIKSLHTIDVESFKGLPETKIRVDKMIQEEIKSGTAADRYGEGGVECGMGWGSLVTRIRLVMLIHCCVDLRSCECLLTRICVCAVMCALSCVCVY